MKLILVISSILFIIGCSTQNSKEEVQINQFNKQIDTVSLYLDTLKLIQNQSLKTDTFSFTQFYDLSNSYNLLYHRFGKTGNLGISAYSTNDSTIKVDLLKKSKNNWITLDTKKIRGVRFSPAMFHPIYQDFNGDGMNDILFSFYQSMSVAYDHGYLVLISNNKLNLIQNSIKIPNLEFSKGIITSITYNHPGHEPKYYKQIDEYIVKGDSLVLESSKRETKQ